MIAHGLTGIGHWLAEPIGFLRRIYYFTRNGVPKNPSHDWIGFTLAFKQSFMLRVLFRAGGFHPVVVYANCTLL